MNTKKCTDCKLVKPWAEFYMNRQRQKPICRCKECSKIHAKKHRAAEDPLRREAELAKQREYQRNISAELKKTVLTHYGDCKCSRCGINDIDVLTLDHIDNDGAEHRRSISKSNKRNVGSTTIYRWIVKNGFPPEYDVLCFNCNIKKHLERLRGLSQY